MKKNYNNKKVKKTPYEIKENTAYFVKNRLPAFILAFLIIFWTIASIFGIIAYAKTKKEDNQGVITASADTMTLTRTEVDLLHFNGLIFPRFVNGNVVPYTLMSNLSFGIVQDGGDYRPYIRVVNQNSFDTSNRVYYFDEYQGNVEVNITVIGFPTNSFNEDDLILSSFNLIFALSTDWNFENLYNYFPYQCSVDFLDDIYESGYAPANEFSCLTSAISFVKESPYGSDNYMNPYMVYLDLVLPYMDGAGFITCPYLSSYVERVQQEENIGIYTFHSINNAQYIAEIADRSYVYNSLESLRLEYNDLLTRYNGLEDAYETEIADLIAQNEYRIELLNAEIERLRNEREQSYTEGKNAGYVNGYDTGYVDGVANANSYSFTGLLSAVFDVPVRTFTSLFNFDLLGINLANFFLSLLTCAIVLTVIRWII